MSSGPLPAVVLLIRERWGNQDSWKCQRKPLSWVCMAPTAKISQAGFCLPVCVCASTHRQTLYSHPCTETHSKGIFTWHAHAQDEETHTFICTHIHMYTHAHVHTPCTSNSFILLTVSGPVKLCDNNQEMVRALPSPGWLMAD